MSNFTFRPSVRENVHCIVMFAGGTGSGKTFSALRLAKGMAGGKKFAVIDTEARRALHYADTFSFDHGDLKAPFRPDAYLAAILAAEDAGYPVAVVDQFSHEHAGEGGLLDWHEEELQRMAGDDWKKREACKLAAWIKPKMAHKKMVDRLLQLRMHLILNFRAETKVKPRKDPKTGKMEFVDAGWLPICAKGLEFEAMVSFLMQHEQPGVGKPLKLPEPLKPFFPAGRVITEACGEQLAKWAAGGVPTIHTNGGEPEAATEEDPPLPLEESEPDIPAWKGKIASVEARSGETRGKKWTVHSIVGTDGERFGTFDQKIADLAKSAHLTDQEVRIIFEESERGKKVTELLV